MKSELNNIMISVVSPVYKGEKMVQELVSRINVAVGQITLYFEIILVEDGSPDESWLEIEKVCAIFPNVKGIKLSRNFGQHYAITAGLQQACGQYIVVMDCDLQDLPEEIYSLYQKALEGYNIVYARRVVRQDSFIKRLSSKTYYALFSYLTDTAQDHTIANFGIYHRQVIGAMLSMGDHIRYFPTMSQWVGFRKTAINVNHGKREDLSSYTLSKLLHLAFNNMISFSDKPLRLAVQLGILISVISFIIGIHYFFLYFNGQIKVLGFTSIMISIWFLAGIIIMILGVLGLYIGKIFEAVKQRPHYIIEKILNL
jgi:glycosyltransferase involved in cell wall biosynthesis